MARSCTLWSTQSGLASLGMDSPVPPWEAARGDEQQRAASEAVPGASDARPQVIQMGLSWTHEMGQTLWCVLPEDGGTVTSCQRIWVFRIKPIKASHFWQGGRKQPRNGGCSRWFPSRTKASFWLSLKTTFK